jgi:putative nucleotidyltransferase with HDIG domain
VGVSQTVVSRGAFVQALKELPAQHIVTARLLPMLDDEDVTVGDLGRVIESDPALSAAVMRLANSPFYGLTKRVESAARAVMVLGFTTVRTLAVSAVVNLSGSGRATPTGFWLHAVATAAASSVVAELCRLDSHAAFSAGLLHDIGVALLFREFPGEYGRLLLVAPGEEERIAAESETFGISHPEVGAVVLEACRFPEGFVAGVAEHHIRPFTDITTTIGRVVWAGERIAEALAGEGGTADAADALDCLGVAGPVERVVELAEARVDELSGFLAEG